MVVANPNAMPSHGIAVGVGVGVAVSVGTGVGVGVSVGTGVAVSVGVGVGVSVGTGVAVSVGVGVGVSVVPNHSLYWCDCLHIGGGHAAGEWCELSRRGLIPVGFVQLRAALHRAD